MISTAQATVVVQINDTNEPPEFLSSHYAAAVSEEVTVGELFFSGIVAYDVDAVSEENKMVCIHVISY